MLHFEDHVDLYPYNTFHIHAHARLFVRVGSVNDFLELTGRKEYASNKVLHLGGGSNILFTDDYSGLVVKNEISGIGVVEENHDHLLVKAGSGEDWHAFVRFCVDHDWGGIENLSLIPGTVGAAPMQNIGAYGVEIKDTIHSVEAVEIASARLRQFTREECQFGYRESIFKHELKNKVFISSVTLRLSKRNHRINATYGALQELMGRPQGPPSIRDISDAVIAIRTSKLPDPKRIGNAGSFFKNPSIDRTTLERIKRKASSVPTYPAEGNLTKVPAAWLIEQCGWKGQTLGNIGVHKHQALVLVNYGGGKGEDIWNLAMRIRDSVQEKFGIALEPEVNVVHP